MKNIALPDAIDGKRGRPTMHDVARRAAVSVATVSRVLNAPETVRPETRERVQQSIQSLSYLPQGLGRRPSGSRNGSIGFLLLTSPGITQNDAIFLKLLGGIEDAVDDSGFTVAVSVCPADVDLTARGPRILEPERVDGLAVTGAPLLPHQIEAIRSTGLPLVVLSTAEEPGVWAVTPDGRRGAEAAVTHLLDIGRRRIVHIGGPPNRTIPKMKRDGVVLAHQRANVRLDPRLYDSGDERHSRECGWRSVERMLADGVEFDGIFADDDHLALGALAALTAHGRCVPDDVSVVGYGGLPEARQSRPALTTVDVDFHQMGWLAGLILTNVLNERSPGAGQIYLDTRLTIRESSVPPSTPTGPPAS